MAATRLFPASGGFNAGNVVKIIRFARMGCANRPFYHIQVAAVSLQFSIHFSLAY